jgi:hypothetical protein
MTKTEYREYIASTEWQQRRNEFLASNSACAKCGIPRWLAEITFDQDLNVHHVSYRNLGNESWDDLKPLCRRCHEVEKYGRSDLREPKSAICKMCGMKHWNPYSDFCLVCDTIFGTRYLEIPTFAGDSIGHVIALFVTCLWILRGRSRDSFLAEMTDIYEVATEASPRIAL